MGCGSRNHMADGKVFWLDKGHLCCLKCSVYAEMRLIKFLRYMLFTFSLRITLLVPIISVCAVW